MARRARYYVVWRGRRTGIFTTWGETEQLVKGFSGARYKSFKSFQEAEGEFRGGPPEQRRILSADGVAVLPSSVGNDLPF